MLNKGLFSSATDVWETPQDFFDALNDEFHFTLDVCAGALNHKCERYYLKAEDGLSRDWSGETVWCNPPYGREIGRWVKKCSEHDGVAVMLLPARTDTRWFHDFIYKKAEIRFIKGRLKFGGSKNSAPFPSMVVIFRKTKPLCPNGLGSRPLNGEAMGYSRPYREAGSTPARGTIFKEIK